MKKTFKDLTEEDIQLIKELYNSKLPRLQVQSTLSEKFGVTERAIRKWANNLEEGVIRENINSKILIYDIETSQMTSAIWWTGKQYVGHDSILEEPKIITICYKWLGSNTIHSLTWDENHCDRKMIEEFSKIYNSANLIVGQNNNKFDNRCVQAQFMRYDIEFNNYVKSFDIMRETKRLFRLPSYSMSYITKALGVETKLQHEGIVMWRKIQFGTKEEQKEYLEKMLDYNRQDIIATEAMYLKLRKHLGHVTNFAILKGNEKYCCPNCGNDNIEEYKTMCTPAGTIQRVFRCKDDGVKYKLTNRSYMKYLEDKMKGRI